MTATPTRPAVRRRTAVFAAAVLLLPSVLLAGKGGLPGITPSPFAFGPVPVGTSSPMQVFTLDNP